MNIRNNKGVTGVDLSVALIIMVLFSSLIATLVYNFTTSSKSVNRSATAASIAISKIEELKQTEYDNLEEGEPIIEYKDENGLTKEKAPYKVTTEITKYINSSYANNLTQQEKENMQDIIKIVKVTVQYSVGTKTESFDISTAITKEI